MRKNSEQSGATKWPSQVLLFSTLTRYNEEWRPLKSPPLSLYFSAMSAKMRILALGFPSHNSLRISRKKMQELHSSFQSTMLGKLQPYVQCRKKTNPFIKKSFTVFETHPKSITLLRLYRLISKLVKWDFQTLCFRFIFDTLNLIPWKVSKPWSTTGSLDTRQQLYCEKKITICQIKRDFLSSKEEARSSWKSIEKEKYGLLSPLTSSFSLCLPSHSAESRAPGFTWTPVALESFLSAHKTTFPFRGGGGKSYCSAYPMGKSSKKDSY